jgi:photosystem II oxygen-evolving enhancer protein 1
MKYRVFFATVLSLCLGVMTLLSSPAIAGVRDNSLTYDQIKGTGLANTCPQLDETSRGAIAIDGSQSYRLMDLCLQPVTFAVKEEGTNKRQKATFVSGKLMTRQTSSLESIEGPLNINSDGSLTFVEEDGIDFQPITVQLPGGEQFPTLFTVKGLVATTQTGLDSINNTTDFEGEYRVPSYRTSNFLDPKGRGLTAGYDSAVGLVAGDDAELRKENIKQFLVGKGKISLNVSRVDGSTNEIAGNFESIQPSETDMGSKEPTDVRIRGIFYARIQPEA